MCRRPPRLARYRRRHAARRRCQRRAGRRVDGQYRSGSYTRPPQQDPADHRVWPGRACRCVCGLALEPRRLGQLAVLRPHRCCASWKRASRSRKSSPWRRGAGRPDLGLQLRHGNETLPDLKLLTRAGADQLRTDQQALPQVTVPDPSVQAKPQQRCRRALARLALRAARQLPRAQRVLPPWAWCSPTRRTFPDVGAGLGVPCL